MVERRARAARPRFACFDGLRAVAVGAIVVHHVALLTGTTKGVMGGLFDHLDIGVAVFFLISGFLLYRPMVSANIEGRPGGSVRAFLCRRFLRIFPAYWLALTATFVVFGAPRYLGQPWDGIGFYGLLQIYSEKQIWGGLAQAWSLCTEVAFYLFIPVYAWAAARVATRAADRLCRERGGVAVWVEAAGLAGLYAVGVGFRAWELNAAPLPLQSLRWFPANLDYFALGMVLALVSARLSSNAERRASPLARALASAPGWWWTAAGVVWLVSNRPGLPRRRVYGAAISLELQFLYGLVAILLLVPAVFGHPRQGRVRRFLSSAPMTAIGRLSYGIYLWHIFVPFMWMRLTGSSFPSVGFAGTLVVTAVGSILVALVSWVVLEYPLLAVGRRIAGPRRARPGLVIPLPAGDRAPLAVVIGAAAGR